MYLYDGKGKGQGGGNGSEWYTPAALADAARRAMGSIDLDPASCELANSQSVRAASYYTAEQDGLRQDWHGNVWLNPPYTPAALQRHFLVTCTACYRRGDIAQACVLINNATEVDWFQEFAREATRMCFLRTRVRFWNEHLDEKKAKPPLQGQVVVYFGQRAAEFRSAFWHLGLTVAPVP